VSGTNLFCGQDTGIPRAPHLFKSFSQIDSAISRRYGAQAWSAICKQLTEIMGDVSGSRVKRYWLHLYFHVGCPSQFHPPDTLRRVYVYTDSLNSYPTDSVGGRHFCEPAGCPLILEQLGYRADAVGGGLSYCNRCAVSPMTWYFDDVQMNGRKAGMPPVRFTRNGRQGSGPGSLPCHPE